MINITLSADKEVIEQARKLFSKRGTTVNAEFRKWLVAQSKSDAKKRRSDMLKALESMPDLNIGRKLTRDELNER
jgi:hypothetical protein